MTTALPVAYRRVLAASSLANLSDGIRLAAFPLLAYSIDPRPIPVSLVAAAGLAPAPMFSLIAGAASDRFDRAALAVRVNQVRAVSLGLLSLLIMSDLATIPAVLVAAFVLGASEVFADNAIGTLVPLVVEGNDLERANARLVTAEIFGNEFAGPALGAVLFGAAAWAPFVSNTALIAAAVLLLAGLPFLLEAQVEIGHSAAAGHDVAGQANKETDAVEQEASAARPMWAGVTFLARNKSLRALTLGSSLLIAIDGAWFSLLVILSGDVLGLGEAAFGVLLGVGAIGGFIGAFLAERTGRLSASALAAAVFAIMAITLVGLAWQTSLLATCLALVGTSGAFAVWNVFAATARQRLTPDHLLGRVSGAYRTVVFGAALIGTLLGGAATQAVGLEACLAGCGFAAALAVPVVWWQLRDLKMAPDAVA